MKKSILLVAWLMALVSLCLVFAGCDSGSSDSSDPTPPPVPVSVTGVTLDKTELTMTVGDADVKLTATVSPEDATDKTVSWSSNKPEFATVDTEGNVHAVAAGEATITVTTVDGNKTADCTVKVSETKKLSEILPSGFFPETADSAWVNADGKKAYKDGDNIKVGNLTLGKDVTVTKSGDNYVCKSGDATVTFTVKDSAVKSITVTGSSDSDGTYAVPPTFKAVYASTDGTLTFYYDSKDHSGTNIIVYENGTKHYLFSTIDDESGKNLDGSDRWGYHREMYDRSVRSVGVQYVIIDESVKNYHDLKDMGSMFADFTQLETLDLSNFDTSNVTRMSEMVRDCSKLKSLKISNFNTLNVEYMTKMFYGCKNLKTLDLSTFNTSKVRNMASMFQSCESLGEIIFGDKFDATKASENDLMGNMFKDCSNLVSVKVAENKDIAKALGNSWTYDNGAYARWGVTGNIASKGFNWDKDVVMTETATNVFVSPAITLTTSDEFKIRLGGDWNKNYGIVSTDKEQSSVIELGTAVTAISEGQNIKVSADGNYIITLDLNDTPTITVTKQ